jgi:hypothetical protein
MLAKVMLDFKGIEKLGGELDRQEYLLLPYVYLFADEILEPYAWDGSATVELDLPSYIKPILIPDQRPQFAYEYAIATYKAGDPSYMGSYFTPVRAFKKQVMTVQGVTAYNSVLLLAAAGLELQLPKVTFDVSRSQEVEQVRDRLEAERKAYVRAVNRLADGAYDRLKSSDYSDAVRWAIDQALLKIQPAVDDFEAAMRGLDRRLIKRIGVDFVRDGIPTIASVTAEKGLREGGAAAVIQLLKVLCGNLFKSMEERKYPEAVYGYKLARELRKTETPGDTIGDS